jgi:hypothetical protein
MLYFKKKNHLLHPNRPDIFSGFYAHLLEYKKGESSIPRWGIRSAFSPKEVAPP